MPIIDNHNLPALSDKAIKRFFKKVIPEPNSGCHLWVGRERLGYGRVYTTRGGDKNKVETAHRIAWEIENGVHPGDMMVLHSCDNTICVNPDHLRVGTQLDNMADAVKRNRCAVPKTGLPRGVKLTQYGKYEAFAPTPGDGRVYIGTYKSSKEAGDAVRFWKEVHYGVINEDN